MEGFSEVVTSMRLRDSWLGEQQPPRFQGRSGSGMFGLCPCRWNVDNWGRTGFREVAKSFLSVS